MYEDFDFGKEIESKYIDVKISSEIPLCAQAEWELKEDMIQICYYNDYCIDVGWYPEFDPNGKFNACIIKGQDWVNPVYQQFCTTTDELTNILKNYVQIITQLSKQRNREGIPELRDSFLHL